MTGPSEFGGFGGLQQPPPHEPTAAEKLRNWHHYTDPADDQIDPDVVQLEEMERNGYKGEDSL